ncbi:uncharacterized protein LOC105663865 [Megachile rotundata]|uniref:uncharacterized protein LOC105663865 n=1 Tax=Megachile rotundata TaxID=143995 RepID=UPI003FD427FF
MRSKVSPGSAGTRGNIEGGGEDREGGVDKKERAREKRKKCIRIMNREEEEIEKEVREEEIGEEGRTEDKSVKDKKGNEVLENLRKDWVLEYLSGEEEAVLTAAAKEKSEEESQERRKERNEEERMDIEECKKRSREREMEDDSREEEEGTERKRIKEVKEHEVGEENEENRLAGVTVLAMAEMPAPEEKKRWRGKIAKDATSVGHFSLESGARRSRSVSSERIEKDKEDNKVLQEKIGQKS